MLIVKVTTSTTNSESDMIIKPVIGGKYKWKGQSNELVYLGYNHDGGWWHQFALTSAPDVIWCETTGKELELLEEF